MNWRITSVSLVIFLLLLLAEIDFGISSKITINEQKTDAKIQPVASHLKVFKLKTNNYGKISFLESKIDTRERQRDTRQITDVLQSEFSKAGNGQVKKEETPKKIAIETLLVFDYEYSKQFNFSKEKITKYVSIFYNGVNRRLETIEDIAVSAVVVGILIIESPDIKFFNKFEEPKTNGVEANEALDKFGKFLYNYKAKNKLTTFDIAMLFFKYDLGQFGKNKVWDNSIAGIAYRGGACMVKDGDKKQFNVAIGEDVPGKFNGILTHSHEIGHLISATHSGVKTSFPGQPTTEKCPPQDKNVMRTIEKNEFYFSTCSSMQIKWFIGQPNSQCIKDAAAPSFVPKDQTFPGKLMSLTDQCRAWFGEKFSYRTLKYDVCTQLFCFDGAKKLFSKGPALEGSPCAKDKHCIRGHCVSTKEI